MPGDGEVAAKKAEGTRLWDEISDGYTTMVMGKDGFFGEMYAMTTDLLLQDFDKGDALRVLDVASNGGEPSVHVARAFPNAAVVSTDIAGACVAVGQRYAASQDVCNVEFRTADAENLADFCDGSFDAVVCTMGIFFMPQYERALAEMKRVTRSGGKLVLATWGRQEDGRLWEIVAELMMRMDPDGAVPPIFKAATRFADPTAELIPAMLAGGWADAWHESRAVTVRCPSSDRLYDLMLSTGIQLRDVAQRCVGRQHADEQQVHASGKVLLATILQERGCLKQGGRVEIDGNTMVFVKGAAGG